MKSWFNGLDAAEKSRRRMFSKQFQADHNAFAKLPLTNARNITFHRTGFANVTVTISGHFGVTYTGNPVRPVPSTETRPIAPTDDPADPAVLWQHIQPPLPIEPKERGVRWFTLTGQTGRRSRTGMPAETTAYEVCEGLAPM
jgi:hypothetical protein